MDDRVIGCDLYNQALTGDIACALTAAMDAPNHIGPKVLICKQEKSDGIEVQMDERVIVFKERAGCAGGGKGILIGENKSFTLSTLLDEAICYPVMSFNPDLGEKAGGGMSIMENKSPTIRAGRARAVVYAVENHPNDSRVKLQTDGKVQTMPSRMGTGGGNVPLILEVRNDGSSENNRAADG